MFADIERLNREAGELFEDALAEAVTGRIEEDANRGFSALRSNIRSADVRPYSATTLFLADDFYNNLGFGEFSGRLILSWNGMDRFIFVPDQENPLVYRTSNGRLIEPKFMETDGGSIPRVLRGLKKFSSWGYAPAFIVHDWLFTAKKCNYRPDNDWTFAQTAAIMAEAMKTLMERGYPDFHGEIIRLDKAEDTLYLMYQAVSSFLAEELWDDASSVTCMR